MHDETRAWLAKLPALEAELARRWRLELGPKLSAGAGASVRGVRRADGSDAVLKLAGPWDRVADEITCLCLWAGGPAPAVFEADGSCGAILLERIVPGAQATDAGAEQVAALLRQMHVPDLVALPPLFETVQHRLDRAERGDRATEPRLAWARAAVARLKEGAPEPVTVHGDFDRRNLLTCTHRGLCTIDPLPCAGDGTFDAASWVHANRRPGRRARFEAIAEALELDRERLRDWCGVIAVLG